MNLHKSIYIILTIVVVLTAVLSACLKPADQGITYDPAKSYAAFLVINTETGKANLEKMKRQSAGEGLEIGPVEYYASGTTDFVPALKKLTASTQVTVVWVNFSSIVDISNIKKAMEKLDYKGSYRYVTDQSSLAQ